MLLQILFSIEANAPIVKWAAAPEFHLTIPVLLQMLFSAQANAPIVKWAVHLTMSVFHKMPVSVGPGALIVKRSWFFGSKKTLKKPAPLYDR